MHFCFAATDSGAMARSRVRRSPLSWPFEPRSVRQLSPTEIDAFNQGLHSKRPKFIGKRRVPSLAPSCRLDAFGNCVPDDGDAADKRGPRRKFMGKKSADDDDHAGDVETIQRATRGRKFVGKRQHRKFLGRRSELDRLIRSEMRSNFDRHTRRTSIDMLVASSSADVVTPL